MGQPPHPPSGVAGARLACDCVGISIWWCIPPAFASLWQRGWKLPGEMVTYGISCLHLVVEVDKESEISLYLREYDVCSDPTVKPRPISLHIMQIGLMDIKFTCVFYEVYFLSVALHQ